MLKKFIIAVVVIAGVAGGVYFSGVSVQQVRAALRTIGKVRAHDRGGADPPERHETARGPDRTGRCPSPPRSRPRSA